MSLAALDAIQQALDALRGGTLGAVDFSRQVRPYSMPDSPLQALPPRYREVLAGLLDRVESSALFSDESCSFSQSDLMQNLQVWIDKARERLA